MSPQLTEQQRIELFHSYARIVAPRIVREILAKQEAEAKTSSKKKHA